MSFLERIPVRKDGEIILLRVSEIVSVVAEGDMLRLTTSDGGAYEVDYRLKDLEARLDPAKFIKLSRGALAAVEFIERARPQPGGMHLVTMANGQTLRVSRGCSKILRRGLFKL